MVIDSYRAIVTDPTNPRVYLLHADAWLEMGKEYGYAKEAIATGQRMCKEGREELDKHYEQIEKLQKEHEEEKYVKPRRSYVYSTVDPPKSNNERALRLL